ncbi:O-antigen ligase family protein [Oleiharenicola sp. Vm1]|uniref:O-antigen ligase family protein n=1 Tax=Oleiharenicola sp. Vm1 TaxID=3398393 RepID=UPI0039F6341E
MSVLPATAPAAPADAPARVAAIGEWVLTLGLAVTLAGTTLGLGGYLAETMVWSARAVWLLAALGAALLVLRPRALDARALLPVPFLLFALASVIWIAPARWLAWREWLLWFQMWLWFALALHFARTRAQTWTLAGTLVGLALAGVAMAAYQRFVDPKWMMLGRTQAEQFVGRSAGMFGIPNSLAALLELVLPLCLVWFGSRALPLAGKILCGWLAAVFVFGLVLTGSRGGWIGAAAALALWPVLTSRTARRGALGALGVVACLAAGLAALYFHSDYARERIAPFLSGEFESSRPIIWRVGWRIWQSAPWGGTGAASYNVVFDQFRPAGFGNEPEWAHNDYLNTLADYGVAGFALWAGAGAALLALGWRAVRERRRAAVPAAGALESWRWRLAWWLGAVAFAVHLAVDFHTKIPALAYAAAVVVALLLRRPETAAAPRVSRLALALGAVPFLGVLAACAGRGEALYRSEALRFESRRGIDRVAAGRATLDAAVPPALLNFQQAVKVDPENGRAWSDLAYATALAWHVTHGNAAAIGRRAEAAAARAIALCPIAAEAWIRQAVALDLQDRRTEAESSFRRAVSLAPHTAEWRYYYAYHLSTQPDRKAEALAEVETCLALDPTYAQAKSLRARLSAGR